MAQFTQQEADTLRNYTVNLPDNERQGFIQKFQSLSDDSQRIAFSRIQGNIGNQPSQPTQNRFILKSSQPGSYSYMDAAKDTGKTLINNFADVGDTTLNTLNQVKEHPFQSAGNVASGAVNAVLHPIDTVTGIGQDIKSKIMNASNKPVDAALALGGAGLAMQGGVSLLKNPKTYETIGNVGNAAKNIPGNIGKFFNFDQKALNLGQKVRAVASEAKQSAVDKFGLSQDMIQKANPNSSVSMSNVVEGIQNPELDISPEAKSVFKRTPILKDMLKSPTEEGYISPDSISLQDTQKIINYINTKVPNTIKYNHLDILDILNDTRAAQLDAFPEMQAVKDAYGKFANDYKLIRSALNPKNTPNAILSNFNNNIAVKDAAQRVLAPVIKDMSNLRRQVGTVNILKKIGIGATGLEGAHLGYKVITGN